VSRGHSLSPLTGHAPLASAPNAPFCAHHRKRRRAFSSKPECPFLRNHDKLGPLPLPNGDSIEPLDSSSELGACGTPGSFFSLAFRNPKSRGRPGRTQSFGCHERRAYPRTNRATAKRIRGGYEADAVGSGAHRDLLLSGLAGSPVGWLAPNESDEGRTNINPLWSSWSACRNGTVLVPCALLNPCGHRHCARHCLGRL